ncbi:MAG: hypothetical protein LBQ54_09045 [Planctomycetaceae bacterium]|jgi:hypothetical protein|nr:hypothetical protein [Planctomycetaceae bacterium]
MGGDASGGQREGVGFRPRAAAGGWSYRSEAMTRSCSSLESTGGKTGKG